MNFFAEHFYLEIWEIKFNVEPSHPKYQVYEA